MADFPGFIGGAYEGRSVDANSERLINLYPVLMEGGKGAASLNGTPGLTAWTTAGSENIRALYPYGNYCLAASGPNLYRISTSGTATSVGYIGYGDVSFAECEGQLAVLVSNRLYSYDGSTVSQVTWVPSPSAIAYANNKLIVVENSTKTFYLSDTNDITSGDLSNFDLADLHPDNVLYVLADHNEVWFFGPKTIEGWYYTGAAFPFSRIPSAKLETGLAAKYSVAQALERVFFLGQEQGGGYKVYSAAGFQLQAISTPAIEYQISTYSTVSDAKAFTYTQEGHTFYVLTFPTAKRTWVYDVTTQIWHQRRSYGEGRWRAASHAFFNGKHYVGDFENNNVYELSMSAYSDNGDTIERVRRTKHIYAEDANIFYQRFTIDFEGGVGLSTGTGSDPQAMLRYSDDGGHTWSNEAWVDIGVQGKYGTRSVWRRLGKGRDRVFEVTISDPVKVVMTGASLDFELGR